MKTEVIMKRELFGIQISQKSKSEFFSATDLKKAGDRWRYDNDMSPFNMSGWLKQTSTREYIDELEKKIGGPALSITRGRNGHTYVHPLLFIDMALAISPTLKVEMYGWLFDNLIKFRNTSGDSYRRMSGALWAKTLNKQKFSDEIADTARRIRDAVGVENWQEATEKQLKVRDKMHENIALLAEVMNNNREAIRLGIKHTISQNGRLLEKS